ncbi:hypothetical protein Aca07nite_30290 [Actinoplanes capillaceus]|uniref:ABC transporter permease n=1 Tax=Actinoplanes campanulatus TaxID=113559 RepID=A0ABQ3WHP1_9ACTN|nr:hypothetical protein [Actinoplanes capillaceus]GID45754.1 hypothetical protein Aca07nite_30290 [Actinoplanes capillaceus]
MIQRILRIELRHGSAPLAALAATVALTWLLVVNPAAWLGQWGGLAVNLRACMLVLCPLFLAAGAWQAGRDRRARTVELLGTVPRPAWHPMLAGWAAVTLGGLAGLLPPLLVAAAMTARLATYAGPGWWGPLPVVPIGLAAASALGVLIGRWFPGRATPPVAGLVLYVGLALPIYFPDSRWAVLSPVTDEFRSYVFWPASFHVWQAAWLGLLAATFLLLATRRWWAAVAPAALAGTLLVAPPPDRPTADPGALELVCTERAPQVCVTRINEFLLADVDAVLRPGLERLAGIPGTPVRAVEETVRRTGEYRPDIAWFSLNDQARLTGGVDRRDWLETTFRSSLGDNDCPPPPDSVGDPTLDPVWRTELAADLWMEGDPPPELTALPEERQREWIGRVFAASRACDRVALGRLALS